MLLASNLDNIPDCPELLNYGASKAMCVTTHHHSVPVPIVVARMTWQTAPRCRLRTLCVADLFRVVPSCFVQIAQHAADTSPPLDLA
jgi:hypothetical protein